MGGKTEYEEYFPEEQCINRFSELSLWTTLEGCLAAARYLENRTIEEDCLEERLIIQSICGAKFETVLIQCFQWLIASYRVPLTKLKLAKLIDSSIKDETVEALIGSKFKPNIIIKQINNDRSLIIEDEPHIIELIQNPINCMLDLLYRAWETPEEISKLKEKLYENTGGIPNVFHQPYTDGPLPAIIEAIVFYIHGLEIGPHCSPGINQGYRSVEVVGQPPFNPDLFDMAQKISERIFKSLESN